MTPIAAEEGLSDVLTPQPSIGSYGSNTDFSPEELEALDGEGRTILTEHRLVDGKSVVIINVYCPRADKENKERVDFKLKFYKLLQERAEAIVKTGRYVVVYHKHPQLATPFFQKLLLKIGCKLIVEHTFLANKRVKLSLLTHIHKTD